MNPTKGQLALWRAEAEASYRLKASESLALIAEVERLRELLQLVSAVARRAPENWFARGVNKHGDAVADIRRMLGITT